MNRPVERLPAVFALCLAIALPAIAIEGVGAPSSAVQTPPGAVAPSAATTAPPSAAAPSAAMDAPPSSVVPAALPGAAPAGPIAPAGAPIPTAAVRRPVVVRVSIQTSMGTILLDLEQERAPITTANFLRYAQEKRYDGATFYRAVKAAPGYALIQGGLEGNPKRARKPIAHEPTTLTGLSHVDGAISMARGAPGTAAGDFFIIIGGLTSLDADPGKPDDHKSDKAGYAVFGHVAEGMETVRRILDLPISPTKGKGEMQGQMIEAPVRIIAVRRLP